MKKTLLLTCILALVGWGMISLTETTAYAAPEKKQKDGANKAKAPKGAKAPKQASISGKYKSLTDLTEAQKQQIAAIQKETADKIKELKKAEDEKIMSLLTPEQKQKLTQHAPKGAKGAKAPKGKKAKPKGQGDNE